MGFVRGEKDTFNDFCHGVRATSDDLSGSEGPQTVQALPLPVARDDAHLFAVILDDLYVGGDLVSLRDILFHHRLLLVGRELVGRDLFLFAPHAQQRTRHFSASTGRRNNTKS